MSREAFENWAEDGYMLGHANGRYSSRFTQCAWEAWQAALQSGEAVAWCFTDVNGKPKELVDHPKYKSEKDMRIYTPLYTTPQLVADAEALLNELSCLYWFAYHKGHDDTVEACYADVHTTDRFYYWMDQVKEIASEGDVPVVNALLKATVKDSLTVAPQPVVDESKPTPPCDCIENVNGRWVQSCECRNVGDLLSAHDWCTYNNLLSAGKGGEQP